MAVSILNGCSGARVPGACTLSAPCLHAWALRSRTSGGSRLWWLTQAHRLSQDTRPLSKALCLGGCQGGVPSLQEQAEGRVSSCSAVSPQLRDPGTVHRDGTTRLWSEGVSDGLCELHPGFLYFETLVKGRRWVPSGCRRSCPCHPSGRFCVICPEAVQRSTPSTSHPWTGTCPAPCPVTWSAVGAGRVHSGQGTDLAWELPCVYCLVFSAFGCCFCPRWPSPGLPLWKQV